MSATIRYRRDEFGAVCPASNHGQCVHFLATRDSADYMTERDDADRRLPVFVSNQHCVKCVMTEPKPRYIASRDVLVVTCGVCGWTYETRPAHDVPCEFRLQVNAVVFQNCILRSGHRIEHDYR